MHWIIGILLGLYLGERDAKRDLSVHLVRANLRGDLFSGVVQGLMEELDCVGYFEATATEEERETAKKAHPAFQPPLTEDDGIPG